MQTVSNGDNWHEMSDPVFWENYFKMSSAENFTQSAKRYFLENPQILVIRIISERMIRV